MGLFGSDRYITIDKPVPYKQNIQINEHKAPTDDSIKLYKELEEKALKNVKLNLAFNNIVNAVCIETRTQLSDCVAKKVHYICFKLNDEYFEFNVSHSEVDEFIQQHNKLLIFIAEKISIEITRLIIDKSNNCFTEVVNYQTLSYH